GTWRSRGEDTITWPVTTTGSGRYRVYARWPQHGTADRKAPYTIQHNGGVTTIQVDQRNSGGSWVLLGSFDYSQGTQYDITLSNETSRYVIGDAIKLVPEDEVANSATWRFTPEQSGRHSLFVRWPAYPDRAANAHYRVSDDRGTRSLILSQRKSPGRWLLLGDFEFTQGQEYPITLAGHGDGYVVADAIQAVPAEAEPNRASWQVDVPYSGAYRVYARWSDRYSSASNAQYRIDHAAGVETVYANQRQNRGRWNLLGTFEFGQGINHEVSLSDRADGYLNADAIKVSPVDAQPNRFIWHLDVPVTAEYKVYARWTATPDRDRNATYVIAHDGGESPVTVNQQLKGARWNLLGTYSFTHGAPHHISITDQEEGVVVADGIQLIPVIPE
ncbi:MAG: hypothetical protein ABW148_16820, partial [Sedimenticola sp.]